MNNLLFDLIKSMAVVAVFAYLLGLETNIFRELINRRTKFKTKVFLSIFFGLLSLSGTYLGIYIHNAYANIRAIGAVVGGLLGGPSVGIAAGLIGGVHRYFLGGFTASACAMSTIIAGIIGGIVYYYRPFNKITLPQSFLLGVGVEVLEMIIVLYFSFPYSEAYQLVKIIALPMILSNALGITFFIDILQKSLRKEEEVKALQSYKALKIANKAVTYLRHGLNYESATETARIILDVTEVAAVSITDRKKVLAHHGLGVDHHSSGEDILTQATKDTIERGYLSLISNKEELGCPVENCMLSSAVIAPLTRGDEVIGVLKLYKTEEKSITNLDIELAKGISELLSNQLHISRLEKQAQLATEAELKALQAQIHPHFLFNSLNTIISFCRTEPQKARELLMKLSKFFRKTLKENSKIVSLKKELEYVSNYIAIEKARFGSRLKIDMEIDEELLDYKLPSFTVQPIVQNAVKHGIAPKTGSGKIEVKAIIEGDNLVIQVKDNGVGIAEEELAEILELGYGKGCGIGLTNVEQRIKKLYGTEYGLEIDSEINQGTKVNICLPSRR